MTEWADGRLVAFDLETTGVDPEEARIVTAAVVGVGGGQPMMARTWLADPGVEIPGEAAAVHGVTTERAREEGRPAAEVIFEVCDRLATARDMGIPLVIFNARYDLTVLDRECRRHGLPPFEARRVVDPLVIDKWLWRYRKGSRKLLAICGTRGALLDEAHEAGADALAAARLAWVLAKKGQFVEDRDPWHREEMQAEWDRVRVDPDALHDAQIRWAAEQAISLAEHFRREGKVSDADGVRTEWPVVPVSVAA